MPPQLQLRGSRPLRIGRGWVWGGRSGDPYPFEGDTLQATRGSAIVVALLRPHIQATLAAALALISKVQAKQPSKQMPYWLSCISPRWGEKLRHYSIYCACAAVLESSSLSSSRTDGTMAPRSSSHFCWSRREIRTHANLRHFGHHSGR
jgi:hypothetical protein